MIHNDDDKNDNEEENNGKTEDNGNKARYTATPVACGWVGAIFELLEHWGRGSEAKDRNAKRLKRGRTDGQSRV